MRKVLLVEDNPSDVLTVKFLLKNEGCLVDVVQNAMDAFEKSRTTNYDLVLLDWFLPQFSGIEFLKTIRKDPKLKNLPVIMLSGRNELKDIKSAISEGVNDYIVKPIDPLIFKTKTAAILNSAAKEVWKMIDLPETGFSATGKILDSIRLLAISEVEIKFSVPTNLQVGSTHLMQFDLFKDLGIDLINIRIAEAIDGPSQAAGMVYIGRIVGLTEKELAKIRIISKTLHAESSTVRDRLAKEAV